MGRQEQRQKQKRHKKTMRKAGMSKEQMQEAMKRQESSFFRDFAEEILTDIELNFKMVLIETMSRNRISKDRAVKIFDEAITTQRAMIQQKVEDNVNERLSK